MLRRGFIRAATGALATHLRDRYPRRARTGVTAAAVGR